MIEIFSCILNERLYLLLDKHGIRTQFGATPNVGCQDGSFTLKSLLHLRHQHNLPTFVAFVDLVKAYDTTNHQLLIEILRQYGAPPKLCNAIERMYQDLVVIIKVGSEERKIPQTVGVRQGDNLSPVLFLFMMSAFAEVLEYEWEKSGMRQAEFVRVSQDDFDNQVGQILGHGLNKAGYKEGIVFKIMQILYLDDGAFIFDSRSDLIKGVKLIDSLFKKFGMEMHVGKDEKASKTECIMFPPPGFLKQDSIEGRNNSSTPPLLGDTPIVDNLPNPGHAPSNPEGPNVPSPPSLVLKDLPPKKRKRRKKKILYRQTPKDIREDYLYDIHPETRRAELDDGYVEFTKHFPYLGSFVSYNLKDDFDISKQIAKAFQCMGMLKYVWVDPHIDLYSKYLFFIVMPLNLLLWGCEAWAIKQTAFDNINVFYTNPSVASSAST